jgi:spoIIIJ-associated protein
MNENRATLEVIAPSIEEAIEKGLRDLGLTHDDVEINVLDEGSKGLFGLGSRQARVRLVLKSEKSSKQIEEAAPSIDAAGLAKEDELPHYSLEDIEGDEEERQFALQVARDTVSELLQRMSVRANVSAKYIDTDVARNKQPILVDISGKDLSILIGRQSETLNALQYIATLIISKELSRSITVTIDVQGYRQRREHQIRQLAQRLADQAVKTGRRQVLEPMPANERRLIHLELRNHPQVITESVGEEPRRKVTIIPK